MEKPPKKLTDDDGDELPSAPLKRAKGDDGASMPSSLLGRDNDGGTRGMMLAGSHPAAVILNGMATIEQQVKAIAAKIPAFASIAAPDIDKWKAAIAAGLSDLVSGGSGQINMGSPGAGVPPGAPAGMPMMAPPPPQMVM